MSAKKIIQALLLQVVFISLLQLAHSQKKYVPITPCDDPGKGRMRWLSIEPCNSFPCKLRKRSTVKFEFLFISHADSRTGIMDATVNVLGYSIPVPGLEKNLCKKAVKCPIRKGQGVKGGFNLKILPIPVSKTTVEVNIGGDDGTVSSCFRFPVILV